MLGASPKKILGIVLFFFEDVLRWSMGRYLVLGLHFAHVWSKDYKV